MAFLPGCFCDTHRGCGPDPRGSKCPVSKVNRGIDKDKSRIFLGKKESCPQART